MDKERIEWVDYAKGIGIILVVYGHVARGLFNAHILTDANLFHLVDSIIYSFHMPLFFMLSGLFFLHSLNKRGVIGLFQNKIETIIYPYVLWSLVQGLIEYISSTYTNNQITVSDIYSLAWQPHDQFWFLYALFLVFFVYTLLVKTFKKNAVLLVVSLVLFLFQTALYVDWRIFNSVFGFGVYFVFGIILAENLESLKKCGSFRVLTALSLFVIFQVYFHLYRHLSFVTNEKLTLLLVSAVSIVAVVILSEWMAQKRLGLIGYIGKFSLEIYLLHVIFASGFRIVLQKFFHIDYAPVHLISEVAIGLFIPIFITLYARKYGLSFLFAFPKLKINKTAS